MKKVIGRGAHSVVLLSCALAPPAMAACSDPTPASGVTVTCSGAGIAPVAAQPGSTNVTVNIDNTATSSFTRAVNPVGISVEANSTISNSGQLSLSGAGVPSSRGAVLLGTGSGNQITNAAGGSLTTTGAYNDGMGANGSSNTLINHGTITTAGPFAYGMSAVWILSTQGQTNNTIINSGTVSTSGTGKQI